VGLTGRRTLRLLAAIILAGCGTHGAPADGGVGKDAGPLPPDPCVAAGTCPAGAAAFLRKPIPLQKFFDTVRGFVEAGMPRLAQG